MIIYWKLYYNNECVAQEAFKGAKGGFFMELEMYRRYSQMARGVEKAELVFKNGRVFSSGTGEFIDGDVAVADGIVIGVGTYEGETEIDLEGKVICPGFIDSHLHLESTLVTPGELVRQAAQCGTTTFIVDPHESANVSGTDESIISWIRQKMHRRMYM